MALGTPVVGAVAYTTGSAGSSAYTVTPAYPTGILASDVVLVFLGLKPANANGGNATTPTGWTLRDSLTGAGGYGTTLGADTGNTNLYVYSWDAPVAGQTGTLSISGTDTDPVWAFMVRIPTGGGTLSYGSADGSQTTAPTANVAFTVNLTNGASATNFKSGDLAIWAMCIPTDVTTPAQFSTESITATGATFGTAVEINEPDTVGGNDLGGYSAYASCTAGSSTAAPSVTVTATGTTTNVRGPVVLLRVRESQALTLDAASSSYTITGQAATTSAGRSVNAASTSYALTGQAATTSAARALSLDAGSLSISGQAATTSAGRSVNAASTSYAITGQAATTSATRALSLDAGAYTLAGQAASFFYTHALSLDAGSYALTGQAATVSVTRALSLSSGAYTLTGQAADLSYGSNVALVLNAGAGGYALTGAAAALSVAKSLALDAGEYTLTGAAAGAARTWAVNLAAGDYTITGQPATLDYRSILLGTAAIASDSSLTASGGLLVSGTAASVVDSTVSASANRVQAGTASATATSDLSASSISLLTGAAEILSEIVISVTSQQTFASLVDIISTSQIKLAWIPAPAPSQTWDAQSIASSTWTPQNTTTTTWAVQE